MKNNPKRFLPQILAVALGISLVYFICIIGGGIKFGLQDNVTKPYEKMSLVFINKNKNNDGDNQKLCKDISQDKNVEKVIYCSGMSNIEAKMIVESSGSTVLYTKKEDTAYLLQKFNFKLMQGRIPENADEILFQEDYARGLKLKVGDYYGTDVNENHDLDGKYKIVGLYKGRGVITFAGGESIEDMKKHSYCLIVVPKEGKLDYVNNKIKEYKDYKADDLKTQEGYLSSMFTAFNIFAAVVVGITVFVVTFTISNINYVHFYERMGEFSIFDALGYRKSKIISRLISEQSVIILSGSLLGLAAAIFGGYVLNEVYCVPNGFPVRILNIWYILISIMVPIFVSLFSTIPVRRFIRKMNTIDVLEGR